MSLFDKDELRRELAATKKELLAGGSDEETAERLTRKEFEKWLANFTGELRETIRANAALPVEGRDERIARIEKDFDFFRRTYFPHYFYLPGKSALQAHLETIYYRIAKRAKERIKAERQPNSSWEYKAETEPSAPFVGEKFALAAPRGHGKSTDVSVVFVIWLVARKLKHFITLFSDAIELTETLIESIKAELEDNERLQADFPHVCGIGRSWKIGDIVTRNGVRIKGYGSAKRVRGIKHGVWRPDIAIIDDLENDENVRSDDQRDKLENWLDDAIDNLGEVTDTMDILYIGTLLHRDAVLARKLQLAFWNPKVFRAIMRFPDNMDPWEEYTNLYNYVGETEAHEFYLANKPDMDKGAKVLWPEAVPLETLMRKRARSKRSFDKEQQNNPGSEDQKFKRETMHFYNDYPRRKITYYGYCDPNGGRKPSKKKKRDYANFTVLAVSKEMRKAWVAESISKRIGTKEIMKTIVDLQEEYGCKVFGYEINGGQAHLVPFIKDLAFDRGVHMPLKEIDSTDSKEERIELLEIPVETGEIELHESQVILINQLEDFPEGKHDDAPDGLAGCYVLTKLHKKRKGGSGNARNRAPRPRRQSLGYGRLP